MCLYNLNVGDYFIYKYIFFAFKDFFMWTIFKVLLNLIQYCFCFMFLFFGCVACGISAPQSRIKPRPPVLEGKVLTTGLPGKSLLFAFKSDTTERPHFHFSFSCIGEGNGSPLRCSCLENPRDRRAWWAAVYGVAQSQTRLRQLSSSSSRCNNTFSKHSTMHATYFSVKNSSWEIPDGPVISTWHFHCWVCAC